MISLGRLKIKNNQILAPIANYSDVGLRKICSGYNCGYSFSELIYTKEFIEFFKENTLNNKNNNDPKINKKFDFFDDNKIGIQFITNNPKELKKCIEIIEKNKKIKKNIILNKISSIDLNLGCPDKDVMDKNLGSALLNQPDKIRELFKILKTSSLPVSAKIRLAINSKHKKTKPYLRIGKIAQEEGLDFLTVHLRNSGQMYSGDIDLNALKELKENTKIKLVGNGNIVDEISAKKMLEYCDAIMIGRVALEKPFIFKQIEYYLKHNEKLKLNEISEKKKCIQKYIEISDRYDIGFQHLKIHLQSFMKDISEYKNTIKELTNTKNKNEIMEILKNRR